MSRTAPTSMDTPERALAVYSRSGDPEAMRVLFDLTAPALFHMALTLSPDAPSAEDCLQETYIAMLDKIERYDPTRPVLPWLMGILKNMVLRARRSAGRSPDPARLHPTSTAGEQPTETAEQRELLRRAIEALPEPYRAVALLHFVYGLAPAEIAHVRADPPGTVRSLLSRARERLGRRLAGAPALLLLGEPTLGLEVLRAHVMAAAELRTAALAGSLATTAAGVVLMKKWMALALVASLLTGGLLLWHGVLPKSGEEQGRERAAPPGAHQAQIPTLAKNLRPRAERDALAAAPAGPHVAGRVIDAVGAAIPNARVTVMDATSKNALFANEVRLHELGSQTDTDADGRFFLRAGPEAPAWLLLVQAPGYAPYARRHVRAGASTEVVLDASTRLVGRVMDLEGQAVPGACVELLCLLDQARLEWRAKADASGRFLLSDLPRRAVVRPEAPYLSALLRVSAEGFAPLTQEHHIQAHSGGEETIELYVTRGTTVRGKVLDEHTGRPIPGADVLIWSTEGSPSVPLGRGAHVKSPHSPRILGRARSAPDGAYVFRYIPGKSVSAPATRHRATNGARPLGFVGALKQGYCANRSIVVLGTEGATLTHDLRLWPAATVEGRILDDAGTGLAGVTVGARTADVQGYVRLPGFEAEPRPYGMTGADGRFRLEGVHARADRTLECVLTATLFRSLSHFDQGVRRDLQVRAGRTTSLGDLPFTFEEPGPTTRFRVVNEAGESIWNAAIGHSLTNLLLHTTRDGRASLEWGGRPRPGGSDTVMLVVAPGFATRRVSLNTSQKEEYRIVLRPGQHLAGRVLGPAGEAVEGAWVEVADGSSPLADAFPKGKTVLGAVSTAMVGRAGTDARGYFTVRDLPEGSVHVRVRQVRWGARFDTVERLVPNVMAGTLNLEVCLPALPDEETTTIELSLEDAETRKPIIGARAYLLRRGAGLTFESVSPGRIRITDATPGSWMLHVEAEGYIPRAPEALEILPGGEPRPITVRLLRGVRVQGRVRFGDERVDPTKHVMAFTPLSGHPHRRGAIRAEIGRDGTYTAVGLGREHYRVSAHRLRASDAGPAWSVPTDHPVLDLRRAGLDLRLDLLLITAGALTVRTKDMRLPPPPQSEEQATPAQLAFGGATQLSVFDGLGQEVIHAQGIHRGYVSASMPLPLPPGTYEVRLTWPDGAPHERVVVIQAGKTEDITLGR